MVKGRGMNIFNTVALRRPQYSRFDLSHDVKMSFRMGNLVPTCCMETLPGGVYQISPQNFLRFAPLIAPVMHKVRVKTEYFFVPNRLLWANWEGFITGNNLDAEAPYVTAVASDWSIGSIADYLGYPTEGMQGTGIAMSPMPLAAYRLIWDEYYRDQNLQTPVFVPLEDGDNSAEYGTSSAGNVLRRRAWEHDYFTSALPFAQKGDAVQLPLTQTQAVDVELKTNWVDGGLDPVFRDSTDAIAPSGSVEQGTSYITTDDPTNVAYDPMGTLEVPLQADAVDINTVRRAFRIQEWLEKNARAGTRYVENILAHFGLKPQDARLQRPEYIGGSSQNMVISEVLSTTEVEGGAPIGQMAGHGISVGGGNRFTYKAQEHGFIIGIISVIPDTAYFQGLHRSLQRFDKFDYAWPTFANLGEQPVYNNEVYAGAAVPRGTFGYVPRYAEYKFMNSRVAGEMKDSLLYWHLGRLFSNEPALNGPFVECNPRTDIFAVTDPTEDHIYSHIFNTVSAVLPLPRFGIPTI